MTGMKTCQSALKLGFAGWFHLCPHFIVADWMTAFLLVRSSLFQNYMNGSWIGLL